MQAPLQEDFTDPETTEMAHAVRAGLTASRKTLPSKYLYDDVGSALFDTICLLDEYGLSRAGERLMDTHAHALARLCRGPLRVIELGSGSGKKTRRLLQALLVGRSQPLHFFPIDISASALQVCATELQHMSGLRVSTRACSYLPGLKAAVQSRAAHERLLVLFLGSTIGNFSRAEASTFLRQVRVNLRPGDLFLLATDMVKPRPLLHAAYNDAAGVTAAFNLNILAHVNRRLGANFDLARFRHLASFDESEQRIEMHLSSTGDQVIDLGAANARVEIADGETIWTESSHKFTEQAVDDMLRDSGFDLEARWSDSPWKFTHSLGVCVPQ